jgi:flagellar hook-length control protein FliK
LTQAAASLGEHAITVTAVAAGSAQPAAGRSGGPQPSTANSRSRARGDRGRSADPAPTVTTPSGSATAASRAGAVAATAAASSVGVRVAASRAATLSDGHRGASLPADLAATAGPIAAAATTATTCSAPARATATATGHYGVTLEHAAETVRLTVATAASTGASLARIRLSPAELGGIHVQLQQTAAGLIARVTADHPAAAHVLEQAGGELRRALEGSGISLLGLDIGASGQQGGRPPLSAQQRCGSPTARSSTSSPEQTRSIS